MGKYINKKILIFSPLLFFSLLYLICEAGENTTDSPKGTSPGDYNFSLVHDGLKRTYRIHIPSSYHKNRSMPLVIALHGGGGTGEGMEELTRGGFNTLSEKEGFIVVYPDGVKKNWNDGRKEVRSRAHREKIDDVGFISALVVKFTKELNIDQKRVYVTGISNGALMSDRLACELSEKIAAIALVTGSIPKNKTYTSLPSRPIPVLVINGIADPLVPWEGGEIVGILGEQRGEVISTSETIKFWVTHNRCSSTPVITELPDKNPLDGTRVRREAYSKGREATEVILYAIEGGGHTWPGGRQYLPERIIGKTSKDIDANEVIWNFFKAHKIK